MNGQENIENNKNWRKMKTVNTFTATIYTGAKEHYDVVTHSYDEAKQILQEYCNTNPLCVTLKQIEYIYKDGNEIGFEIGLINYPRFPSTPEEITNRALEIGNIFRNNFNQLKVSVICNDKTYMIGE
jgi:hypothetical protein